MPAPMPIPMLYESRATVRSREIPGIRTAVLTALPPDTPTSTCDDVALLVSELATNVIRHSGARPQETFQVRMYGGEDRLRIEVEDPGAGFDLADVLPSPSERGGHGLRIVERLAADWGIRPGPRPPTVVWFELAFLL